MHDQWLILPKKENEGVGYRYTVSPDEIEAHQKRTIEQIFDRVEKRNRYLYNLFGTDGYRRMQKLSNKKWEKDRVYIIEYLPQYAPDFRRLNQEWIEKYFVMEEPDLVSLNDPEEYILKPGGHIFFAVENGEVLGTVALIKEIDGFELAKMAVAPAAQGRGIGRLLGEAAIAKARELGARHIMLISNRKLTPAITLYEKLGFKEIPLDADNPYLRGDIKMLITF